MRKMFYDIKYWFFETFGQKYVEKIYKGYGDWDEHIGWLFRNKFYGY